MLALLTEEDYWKPKGTAVIADGRNRITYNMGDNIRQLDNIKSPTVIVFENRNGDETTVALELLTDKGLTKLFYMFSPRVDIRDVTRAFNKELDRLKNRNEDRDTGDWDTLPRPFFDGYKEDLVSISTDSTGSVNQHLLNDSEKDRVLVVSGESGSGKTFFSAFGVHEGVPRLYVALRDEDVVNFFDRQGTTKDKKNKKAWHKYLTRLLKDWEGKEGFEDQYMALQMARRKLRTERNEAAWEVVKEAIEKLNNQLAEWFDGTLQTDPLEKFLLVVDEVGREPELAHGLVDGGLRKLQDALVAKGIAKQVGLVLCGTSLDQLRTNSSKEKYLGSDPSMSKVIIMKQTNLEKLENLLPCKKVEMQPLTGGFFSKIYMTNIRIANRALLPFLGSIYAAHEADGEIRRATQKALCTEMNSMKFVPSIYCRLNGLRDVPEDKKSLLFRKSFAFFLKEGIKNFVGQHCTTSTHFCWKYAKDSGKKSDEIFTRGIATKSPDQTSAALKFLAARGFVAPVRPSDGFSWEHVVSLHLHRLLECMGLAVERIELKGAWPPAGEGDWLGELSNAHRVDVAAVAKVIKSKKGAVLTQSVSTAQSADVLALYPLPTSADSKCKYEYEYIWELHQCKNRRKWPTPAESFPSLGIDPSTVLVATQDEKKEPGLFEQRKESVRVSARRSREGLKRLKAKISELLSKKENVPENQIQFWNERVIGLSISQGGRSGAALKSKANKLGVLVMTQEFFEPTFSACKDLLKEPGLLNVDKAGKDAKLGSPQHGEDDDETSADDEDTVQVAPMEMTSVDEEDGDNEDVDEEDGDNEDKGADPCNPATQRGKKRKRSEGSKDVQRLFVSCFVQLHMGVNSIFRYQLELIEKI